MTSEIASALPVKQRRGIRTGRIGVEFDAAAISCVQARGGESGWRSAISRTWRDVGIEDPEQSAEQTEPADASNGMLTIAPSALALLSAGMRGSEASCVLPMELCELRVLHVPEAPADELRLMVQSELEAAGMAEPVFDFWTIPPQFSTHRNLTTVNAIIASRSAVVQSARLLRRAGLDLVAIDSVPTAAARAVSLMNRAAFAESQSEEVSLADLTVPELADPSIGESRPVMVVHVGWHRCTYSLVWNSAPLLTRVPAVSGLRSLVVQVAETLGISRHEVLTVLRGLTSQLPVHPSGRVLRCLVEQIRRWSEPLAEEVLRSAAYSSRPGRKMFPADVLLTGSGCQVPGLAEILTQQLNIRTSVWSMRSLSGEHITGEAALAFAVSAPEDAL